LAGGFLRGEVAGEQRLDRRRLGALRVQAADPRQQPVAVRAGVPVEAAVEDRMQLARPAHVVRAFQHMVQLVGIFPLHVAEGDAGEPFGQSGCEDGGHRKASRYISDVFTASSTRAVGSWARITAQRSGSSSSATGTMLKLAAIGVVRVPQKPDSMPIA